MRRQRRDQTASRCAEGNVPARNQALSGRAGFKAVQPCGPALFRTRPAARGSAAGAPIQRRKACWRSAIRDRSRTRRAAAATAQGRRIARRRLPGVAHAEANLHARLGAPPPNSVNSTTPKVIRGDRRNEKGGPRPPLFRFGHSMPSTCTGWKRRSSRPLPRQGWQSSLPFRPSL